MYHRHYNCQLCSFTSSDDGSWFAHIKSLSHNRKYLQQQTQYGYEEFYQQFNSAAFGAVCEGIHVDPIDFPSSADGLTPIEKTELCLFLVRSCVINDFHCRLCNTVQPNIRLYVLHITSEQHKESCEQQLAASIESFLATFGDLPTHYHFLTGAYRQGLVKYFKRKTGDLLSVWENSFSQQMKQRFAEVTQSSFSRPAPNYTPGMGERSSGYNRPPTSTANNINRFDGSSDSGYNQGGFSSRSSYGGGGGPAKVMSGSRDHGAPFNYSSSGPGFTSQQGARASDQVQVQRNYSDGREKIREYYPPDSVGRDAAPSIPPEVIHGVNSRNSQQIERQTREENLPAHLRTRSENFIGEPRSHKIGHQRQDEFPKHVSARPVGQSDLVNNLPPSLRGTSTGAYPVDNVAEKTPGFSHAAKSIGSLDNMPEAKLIRNLPQNLRDVRTDRRLDQMEHDSSHKQGFESVGNKVGYQTDRWDEIMDEEDRQRSRQQQNESKREMRGDFSARSAPPDGSADSGSEFNHQAENNRGLHHRSPQDNNDPYSVILDNMKKRNNITHSNDHAPTEHFSRDNIPNIGMAGGLSPRRGPDYDAARGSSLYHERRQSSFGEAKAHAQASEQDRHADFDFRVDGAKFIKGRRPVQVDTDSSHRDSRMGSKRAYDDHETSPKRLRSEKPGNEQHLQTKESMGEKQKQMSSTAIEREIRHFLYEMYQIKTDQLTHVGIAELVTSLSDEEREMTDQLKAMTGAEDMKQVVLSMKALQRVNPVVIQRLGSMHPMEIRQICENDIKLRSVSAGMMNEISQMFGGARGPVNVPPPPRMTPPRDMPPSKTPQEVAAEKMMNLASRVRDGVRAQRGMTTPLLASQDTPPHLNVRDEGPPRKRRGPPQHIGDGHPPRRDGTSPHIRSGTPPHVKDRRSSRGRTPPHVRGGRPPRGASPPRIRSDHHLRENTPPHIRSSRLGRDGTPPHIREGRAHRGPSPPPHHRPYFR